MLAKNRITRDQALNELLEPIDWHPTSSIRARQNYVVTRRKEVYAVYPFLTSAEIIRADKWLEENRFRDLWD